MFSNYLKTALRNISKHKVYSSLNVIGLALGIASTILIIFYIRFEFSYDNFHNNSDKIFRISVKDSREGKVLMDSPVFVPPIGPAMKDEIPEVNQYTRFSTLRTMYFNIGDNSWKIENVSYADSTFFELFSFSLLQGNKTNVLKEPYSAVLTESTARKLFGFENPIGKIIKAGNKDVYKVTGIAKDPPANSEIQFNVLLSFSTLYSLPGYYMGWNGGNQYYSYLLLNNKNSEKSVESKLPAFMWNHINKELAPIKIQFNPYLQPLNEIHLKYSDQSGSGLTNIYIFSIVALLIIIIACINFINLSIARATKRLKEIGVRKILGAGRRNLFIQFITEYLLLSLFVLFAVFVIIEILFPYYQNIIGKNLEAIHLFSISNFILILGIILLVGIIAGGYPAFYLSAAKPVNSLKGELLFKGNKVRTRNVLLIVQFAISVGLIICTIIISEQLNFINSKDLGFNKNNLVTIRLFNEDSQKSLSTLRNRIEGIPGVISCTASSDIPSNGFTQNGYFPQGFHSPIMIHALDVDSDFLRTYQIQIKSGRNFDPRLSSDSTAYLINEALAKQLGWTDPIGKVISRNGLHKVIGVVNDFNYNTLYSNIQPLLITEQPFRGLFNFITIKINPASSKSTIDEIANTWKDVNPSSPLEYSFLDDDINQLYSSEQNFREIFFTFSLLAIILALLGLFSLSSLTAEQKTKEIGIRKVLGDTAAGITFRILKEYVILVIMADIFGCLASFYFMNKWLDNFAFHVKLGIGIFLLSILLTISFGIGVVIFNALKAANSNPVKSLRYE
jgi:putative ABC transport system permease protein